jgi:16S rRNA (uracil1498-N3)-methyltransferase
MESRTAILRLQKSEKRVVKAARDLHVIWCMIDSKSVEKVLPFLNEIGVCKISFVACERSQKNFKFDFQRFRRILSSSMQQCGRSEFMEFEVLNDLNEAVKQYASLVYFDFCDTTLEETDGISTILIGCEGGFTQKEKELLKNQRGYRLDSPLVLRSESAVCAISSKILF